jgi:ABC-type multidrug transport system ATPase subunit
MKIEKIDLPEEETSQSGLGPIKMDRLNSVVLIAGKNGSGKTRLLNLLQSKIKDCLNIVDTDNLKKNISRSESNIKNCLNIFENNNNKLLTTLPDNEKKLINQHNEDLQNNIKSNKTNIFDWSARLKKAEGIVLTPEKVDNHVFDFVPKSLTLADSYAIRPQELEGHAKTIYNMGTGSIATGTIPAIDLILKKWINVNTTSIDDIKSTKEQIEKINIDYNKLRKYIKLFLNTDLNRTEEGYAEIFDKRIGEAQLSNGQLILLQFCMALFAQEAKLEDLIIFMDEPENHLHPAALIEVLDKITPHVKNGQVWIATHSINILAHFDPSNIWYIDNGKVSYAGNVPSTVLKGLLGDEEQVEKLSQFLALPSLMASNKFAYESLFYPNVVVTNTDDPQTNQIHEIIKSHSAKGVKIKVLDFGIGKGRLLSAIYENERLRNNDLMEWLDFYGYDKFDENKTLCLKIFEDIYGNSDNRYFNELKDLLTKNDEKTFDFIIMCNVFHEIEPAEWLNLFNSAISPFKLLKEDGYLLVVEDQFLAIGEKAHSKGFLVFDELEFKKLFKITTVDKYHSTDYRKDGRLKSHHIPKSCLSRISADSKKEALEILQQNAKDEIKKLRKKDEVSFKIGKLHGFWAQQLANASLALEEL